MCSARRSFSVLRTTVGLRDFSCSMSSVTTRTEQELNEALTWAVAEAEAQLRAYPAHRLGPQSEHAWSLDAPNGVALYVEVMNTTVTRGTVVLVLVASTTGLRSVFRRRKLERTVELPLDGEAARVPDVLYLVFEDGGHVSAFESLVEAGESLESLDLPSMTGAYSDRGEVISMTPGDRFVEFRPTGTREPANLEKLMRGSRGPQHLVDDPHQFALQVWLSS